MKRFCLSFIRNDRGTSVVELGLIAPVFAMLTMGMIDTARGFSAKLELEQAAQRSVEMATAAGQVGSNYNYLRVEAAAISGRPLADVTLTTTLECNGVPQANFYGVCTATQEIARYVGIRIVGSYQPYFLAGPVGGSGVNGSVPISGDAMVRIQ